MIPIIVWQSHPDLGISKFLQDFVVEWNELSGPVDDKSELSYVSFDRYVRDLVLRNVLGLHDGPNLDYLRDYNRTRMELMESISDSIKQFDQYAFCKLLMDEVAGTNGILLIDNIRRPDEVAYLRRHLRAKVVVLFRPQYTPTVENDFTILIHKWADVKTDLVKFLEPLLHFEGGTSPYSIEE